MKNHAYIFHAILTLVKGESYLKGVSLIEEKMVTTNFCILCTLHRNGYK